MTRISIISQFIEHLLVLWTLRRRHMNSAWRSLCLVILFVAAHDVSAALPSSALAVVLADTPGAFVKQGTPAALKKAEVVRVLANSVGFATVQRIEEPPDYETIGNEGIERSKQPLKVSADVLVPVERFRKVSAWNVRARQQYTACDGGCDYGVTYRFQPDGSFTATSGTGSSESRTVGHLYGYGDLYWARTSRDHQASRYNVFYMRDAHVCNMISCGAWQ